MKVLGIIPARGGSKGIPRKNIHPLGGKPLIAWTIDAARNGGLADLIVSTDDDEIAAVASAHGCAAPFRRPADMSGDQAGAAPVIRHALEAMEAASKATFDAIVYLQPTSPFRRADSIRQAIAAFADKKPDTLVSVTPVPHNMTPQALMEIEDGWARMPDQSPGQFRRQNKETRFARNGPAILMMSREQVLRDALYGPRILTLVMDRLESFDIDDPEDMRWAEALIKLTV